MELVLFNVFIGDVISGSTLSTFASDTKPCGVVWSTLCRAGMPSRRTDRLERWACVLKFSKAKCKVLGRGNPEHNYRLGKRMD